MLDINVIIARGASVWGTRCVHGLLGANIACGPGHGRKLALQL